MFLNGYLDWYNSTRFTPYIGVSLFGYFFDQPSPLDSPAMKAGTIPFSPRRGVFFPSSDFGLKDGFVGGISPGYNFNRNWGIEASYDMANHVSSDITGGLTRIAFADYQK